ncbi:MAG TPA: hypothetical protein VGD59_05085 [Acidisarcina sp.]
MPRPQRVERDSVFLNIPYDTRFGPLYLAYISGLVQLGLTPQATLAIPGGTARLDRIIELIRKCRYSIHDLSRVQLNRTPPATPRFNMPFELGLALSWATTHPARHTWFVFETVTNRAQKSISDLNGADFNIHDGTAEGVMRELRNAFVRSGDRPDVSQMADGYRDLQSRVPALRRQTGAKSLFESSVFAELITLAASLRDKQAKTRAR